MIEIKELKKKFGKQQVLDHINLNLGNGECIALIGPNGCGKTTIIKSILGMVVPDGGEIIFKGKPIRKDYAYRSHIGYMPQIGRYPDNMSIGQVFETIREIRGQQADTDTELFDAFKLDTMLDKRMRTLSGGTTQKVSACLAFLFDPDVLILDEPTAGLDPLASEILKEKIIKEKEKGKMILITSHLLSELDDMITRVVFMQEGGIRFDLSVGELLGKTRESRISAAIASVLRDDIAQKETAELIKEIKA